MKNRFEGCLLGIAVGDAIGAPVEGKSREYVSNYIQKHLKPQNFRNVPGRSYQGDFPFGQVTDDTQFSRVLAQSLVDCEGLFSQDDFAQRLVTNKSNFVGMGRSTRESIEKLEQGEPPHRSGNMEREGNGSAMRVAPLGLLYWNKLDDLRQACLDQGLVTHPRQNCQAGSFAIAVAVAMALKASPYTSDPSERGWWEWHAYHVGSISPKFAKMIKDLVNWHFRDGESREEIYKRFLEFGGTWDFDGISPWVVPSVLWALYSVMRTPKDFWGTIINCIWAAGDVDTMAAMAGAISGAFNGIDKIPAEVMDKLIDQGSPVKQELLDLAGNLYDLADKETKEHYLTIKGGNVKRL